MTTPVCHSDDEIPTDVRIVEISRETVELYKILKFEGMVASGGESKAAIAAGRVMLNGKVETQKRKKVVDGDIIEFGDETIRIRYASTVAAEESTTQPLAKPEGIEQVEQAPDNVEVK